MKFIKRIILIFVFICVFAPKNALAQDEFSIDANIIYNVKNTGKTIITHYLTLENNSSTLYATSYTLKFENFNTTNVSAKDVSGNDLKVDLKKVGNLTEIVINFPDAVVGKGKQRIFSLSYDNSSVATKTGEVWEIFVPKLSTDNSFRNYTVTLKVPEELGLEAYISPAPRSAVINEGVYTYTYSNKDLTETGVSAGFGQFQVFAFNLAYHLENPLPKGATTQISLPPDSAFQKVYIQNINPKPTNVTVDADGNWLATYNLSPRQRVDIAVTGSVQIFASYRSFPKPTEGVLTENLKATDYWQTSDVEIIKLASNLKTPRAIYDYVSEKLKYDFERVAPNVQRMGAIEALKNPEKAICMEFTDLFIAIARAAGIPAREINGFAYTENDKLQPLSLVADVLHSWPEYYDKEKAVWIPVDPTWGSTSGGIDYFDKLDLRHFAFVIHGASATTPYAPGSYKLGPNPQKDVYVSFGKLPEVKTSPAYLSAKLIRAIPFLNSVYEYKVTNPGPQAYYSIYPSVYFDGKLKDREFIEILPPFANFESRFTTPFSLLGKNTPSVVEVDVSGSTVKIFTNKKQVIINSLLMILAVLILIVLLILAKFRKLSFRRFFDKIHVFKFKNNGKNITKSSQNSDPEKGLG